MHDSAGRVLSGARPSYQRKTVVQGRRRPSVRASGGRDQPQTPGERSDRDTEWQRQAGGVSVSFHSGAHGTQGSTP